MRDTASSSATRQKRHCASAEKGSEPQDLRECPPEWCGRRVPCVRHYNSLWSGGGSLGVSDARRRSEAGAMRPAARTVGSSARREEGARLGGGPYFKWVVSFTARMRPRALPTSTMLMHAFYCARRQKEARGAPSRVSRMSLFIPACGTTATLPS